MDPGTLLASPYVLVVEWRQRSHLGGLPGQKSFPLFAYPPLVRLDQPEDFVRPVKKFRRHVCYPWRDLRCRLRNPPDRVAARVGPSVVEYRWIDSAEALGVGEDVDLDDRPRATVKPMTADGRPGP